MKRRVGVGGRLGEKRKEVGRNGERGNRRRKENIYVTVLIIECTCKYISLQITVANFHLWNGIAGHGVPIVLALFMGAWSDKRGRKIVLLLGLLGKLYFSAMIVVNTTQDTWPVEYIVYTATLPMAFTGADVAIFAASFAYLVDVSPVKHRTIRVTIMEVCYLATMPTGIALGKHR